MYTPSDYGTVEAHPTVYYSIKIVFLHETMMAKI